MIEMQQVFGLPKELELVDITMVDEVLTISAVSTQVSPCYPLCGVHASRIHSTYRRQMADVPCGGQYVRLLVQVGKFFCDNTNCARKIFAERLTPFVASGARVTTRLYQLVQAVGLDTLPFQVWEPDMLLGKGAYDIFCRPQSRGPWAFQLMVGDSSEEQWLFRRDGRVRAPWRASGL